MAVPRRRVDLRAVRRAWASPGWAVVGSIAVAAFLTWLVVRLVSTGAVAGTLASVGTGTRAEKRGTTAAKTSPAVAVVRDSAGSATYAVRGRRAALTLRFEGPCWVGLEVSGRSGYVLSQTYQAGEVLRLVRKPGFTLKLGAAWRAHGILNGRTVGPWTGGNVWDVTVMSETAGGRPSGGPKGA